MAARGTKPKPRDQIRHRVPPRQEWLDVVDEPFEGGPPLPRVLTRRALTPPEPGRPLGAAGLELWNRTWRTASQPPDGDALLVLCEQMDERQTLRRRVLQDNDWRERNSLRMLDSQVSDGLKILAKEDRQPASWPAATKRWWAAISRLPHASLWNDADWQFALDTAHLVAAFHVGNYKLAAEIRLRERVMGTTADARRDLRIRYVAQVNHEDIHEPSVVAMDVYRKAVAE